METAERAAMLEFNGHRLATVFHDAGGRDLVIFCHGFRGVKSGPNRLFVTAARELAKHGISSLRFDQCGCGDSEGDFEDVSFADWVATTRAIAQHFQGSGQHERYRVALFGQSMGGAAVICAASELADLTAVVAWSPGAKNAPFVASPTGYVEEGGQRVSDAYWREAHEAAIAERFASLNVPAYVVFGTADKMVEADERNALIEQAKPNHRIEMFEGYVHSAWTYDQAADIVARSCAFLADAFAGSTVRRARAVRGDRGPATGIRKLTKRELDLLESLCSNAVHFSSADPLAFEPHTLRAMADSVVNEMLYRGITDGELNAYGIELDELNGKLLGTAIDAEQPAP